MATEKAENKKNKSKAQEDIIAISECINGLYVSCKRRGTYHLTLVVSLLNLFLQLEQNKIHFPILEVQVPAFLHKFWI